MPQRVVIAGGGYIANEFAGVFREFGVHVTIVNRSDTILREYDESVRDRLLQISMAKGINFRFNARFERIEKSGGRDNLRADQATSITDTSQHPM